MKKYRNGETNVSMALVLLIAVVSLAGYLWWKQGIQPGAIRSISDLDAANQQLDKTDIDGLGNEFPQIDADASTF